jgi:pyruvate kinase
MLPGLKTKIVGTIGPASDSQEILKELIVNGLSVARLNFAHGDVTSHARTIRNIRAAAEETGKRVAILADLPGPKIRIGRLAEEPIFLARGAAFSLHCQEIEGDVNGVSVSFTRLADVVKPGDQICLNDGFILLNVQEVQGAEVRCLVAVGGELRSNKGMNLPGLDLGISAFTDEDHQWLRFAADQGIDAIGQSFVQDETDVQAVREAAADLGYKPFIIAKIERAKAVENLDSILEAADGIMVARGDLGVEIPIEEMAITQKTIIRQANLAGKPVITATHMLESMTKHSRPTRAEATDVANAILDGTDCLMLSGETASGSYPVESVSVMSRIAVVTEPSCCQVDATGALEAAKNLNQTSMERRVSLSVYLSAEAINPVVIVTPTLNGSTPRLITRFRLPMWIVAYCANEAACQSLNFSYGVQPILMTTEPDSWGQFARRWLRERGFTKGLALLTNGIGRQHIDMTNQIEIIDLGS